MVTDIQEAEEILYVDNNHESLPWDVSQKCSVKLWPATVKSFKRSEKL